MKENEMTDQSVWSQWDDKKIVPGEYEGDTFCRKQIGIHPRVLRYRVLIRAPYVLEGRAEKMIKVPEEYRVAQRSIDGLGLVLAMGPGCFKGPGYSENYISDYKEGDWVHFSFFEKEQLMIGDILCYYINDDRINAVVDPDDVAKALGEYRI